MKTTTDLICHNCQKEININKKFTIHYSGYGHSLKQEVYCDKECYREYYNLVNNND